METDSVEPVRQVTGDDGLADDRQVVQCVVKTEGKCYDQNGLTGRQRFMAFNDVALRKCVEIMAAPQCRVVNCHCHHIGVPYAPMSAGVCFAKMCPCFENGIQFAYRQQ